MSVHLFGVLGLVLIFVVGTLRPVNLGALALVMTFAVALLFPGASLRELYGGFPVDLLVLLVGVTYLFGIAANNGTVERIVAAAAGVVRGRRALLPWIVFVVAALPTMAGALGSAGVALIAPIALGFAQRYALDPRMIGLMVLHGAACGNFSPLNVLGAIVLQAAARNGIEISSGTLFFGNIAYNVALGVVIYILFGGLRLASGDRQHGEPVPLTANPQIAAGSSGGSAPATRRPEQLCTLAVLAAVAAAALFFDLGIGFLALAAACLLHLVFPRTSAGAERRIAWSVVLLVCGIVTYVAALQRYGTVDVIGAGIASLNLPLASALLICAVGALTSAFASSAGILGAMMLLAVPFMAQGAISPTGLIVALSISATVVDSAPFSTAGALVVANTGEPERAAVFRGLLVWGGAMVLTAPPITWLLFIVLPG